MPCYEIQPGVHICRPSGQLRQVPKRRRRRFWCFKCRKHLLHTLMRFYHTQPSYYEDWVQWECPECHEENILFPGHEWVYDE